MEARSQLDDRRQRQDAAEAMVWYQQTKAMAALEVFFNVLRQTVVNVPYIPEEDGEEHLLTYCQDDESDLRLVISVTEDHDWLNELGPDFQVQELKMIDAVLQAQANELAKITIVGKEGQTLTLLTEQLLQVCLYGPVVGVKEGISVRKPYPLPKDVKPGLAQMPHWLRLVLIEQLSKISEVRRAWVVSLQEDSLELAVEMSQGVSREQGTRRLLALQGVLIDKQLMAKTPGVNACFLVRPDPKQEYPFEQMTPLYDRSYELPRARPESQLCL